MNDSKMSFQLNHRIESIANPKITRQDNIREKHESMKLSSSSSISSPSFSSHSSEYDDVLPLPKFTERRRNRSYI